ncbi:GDSL esterase/lipase At4g18970-like [Salvia miltiorrhiza]|uniref:GDSL esterase/lipase At4g18970-like n=1 Tax=Salvia miltiorrhiza TaxID=226208 RepID=UPI0025ABF6A2|nr:GDSL esterase/lipase At4g18970-like [Salvia miltiorrhiza]
MATTTSKCIILAIIFVAITPQLLIHAQQKVPCFFPFGDSLFDSGNNNNLLTLLKANYPPYGIDFIYGSTGRFTNGKHIPDILGQLLGYVVNVPPNTIGEGTNTVLRGVNYASGGAGILDETSLQLGQQIPMNQQLKNHQVNIGRIATILGNQTAANHLLRQCLYTVDMGNSDYVNNYYALPLTLTRILYSPESFAEKLIHEYSQQLTTLYNLQARKVAVFGLQPLGCIPRELFLYPPKGTACVDFINDAVRLFNTKLISLVRHLNTNLPGANFTYINTYGILSGNFAATLGIKVPNASCCEVNKITGLCVQDGAVCSNRDEYTYFDDYHLTQIVANYTTSRAYIAQTQSDATPVDIQTLIRA